VLLDCKGFYQRFILLFNSHNYRATREITYGFTGDESPEELTAILDQITGGTFDEIDDMIRNLMGTSESRMANPEEERKFRQMKILVLWLQNSKKFGRYCFYGCYCLPEGSHNIAAGGYGKPQDSIDKACFDFKQCYRNVSHNKPSEISEPLKPTLCCMFFHLTCL
jgi:hypothetical protein